MDINNLKGLMEAYQQVNAPQEVDEGKVELDQERRSRMGRQIGKKIRSAETEYSLSKDTMYPKGLRGAMEKGARKKVGQAQKIMGALKSAQKEEFDIFDLVLEFLQAEGFAETLEEAEWMMANMIDEEIVDAILDEAIYSRKGLAKAAEMIAKRSTPSGRAKSGKGANVAHIRQIRGSGRGDFDREGLGGTPMTPTMAKNPIKKQNYVGTGNKAARRAGTYKD